MQSLVEVDDSFGICVDLEAAIASKLGSYSLKCILL